MLPRLICAVEGEGDEKALPKLIFKVVPRGTVIVDPRSVKRDRFMKPGEMERWVKLALMEPDCAAILVLLDADGDEDCPAKMGPELLERLKNVASHKECRVVFARHEFETWFIAGIESLRGLCGLRSDLACPADPEGVRGAKEWLGENMEGNLKYTPTEQQARFTSKLDIALARSRSKSLRKFLRDMESLAKVLQPPWTVSN